MEIPESINKFVLSFISEEESAKYVLFGVPENSGSEGLAYFEGSSLGPNAIRNASQLYCAFHRSENGKLKTFVHNSYKSITDTSISFIDIGDKKKSEVKDTVFSLSEKNQFPIIVGGDHSITYEALRGIDARKESFAVVYFDSHPDFRSSDKAQRKSYATVMYDSSKLPNIKIKNSIQVGISDIESEEFETLSKSEIKSLKPLDIENIGIKKTLQIIKKTVGRLPFYISIDLDVLDSAFAPEVASPSVGGLSSRELLFLLTELAKENVIGLDIMECTPKKDANPINSTIGARLIIEFIVRHNAKG